MVDKSGVEYFVRKSLLANIAKETKPVPKSPSPETSSSSPQMPVGNNVDLSSNKAQAILYKGVYYYQTPLDNYFLQGKEIAYEDLNEKLVSNSKQIEVLQKKYDQMPLAEKQKYGAVMEGIMSQISSKIKTEEHKQEDAQHLEEQRRREQLEKRKNQERIAQQERDLERKKFFSQPSSSNDSDSTYTFQASLNEGVLDLNQVGPIHY